MSSRMSKTNHTRLAKGLCTKCGTPNDRPGFWYCTKCASLVNTQVRENKKFFLSIRICPLCHTNKLYGTEKSCVECRAKKAEYSIKDYARHRDERNAMNRVRNLAKYRANIEAGVCAKCGIRKAVEGKRKCEICQARENELARMRRIRSTQ